MARHTIIVADDHPLYRNALTQAVHQAFDNPDVLTAETFEALKAVVATHADADLLLLDLNMPGSKGYSALVYLRHELPGLPVVVVSAYDQPDIIRRALEHGAAGFIPKTTDMETMAEAFTSVLEGGQWVPDGVDAQLDAESRIDAERINSLTPQQLKVLMLIIEGMLNKQIAIELAISEATVKAHITAILRKLGVYTRTQAVIAARNLEIDWDALTTRPDQAGED